MSDSERDLTALHGPALLNGTFSRDTTMRDVLEMVSQFKDIEFGLFRILSKELRGYFAVSFGKIIIGAHTTSSREFGVPALRELLAANRGMFIFAQLKEFPIEVRQSLEIPLNELLDWRPEGVPPEMVASLQDALRNWEPAQAALEQSECMDALRYGTLPATMDAAEEEASFMNYWGGGVRAEEDDDRTPAKPLSALLPNALSGGFPARAEKPQNPLAVTVEILPNGEQETATQKLPDGDVVKVKQDVAASWAPQGGAVQPAPQLMSQPAPSPQAAAPQAAAPKAAAPQAPMQPTAASQAITPPTSFPALPSMDEELDASQIRPDVAASWAPSASPTPPSTPAQPAQPRPPQPPQQPTEMPPVWSKSDLDAIGRIEMPVVEEPKSGLGVSGRFKPNAPVEGTPDELRVSQRVHRPDPELSASGKFIAAEIAAAGGFQPGAAGPNFDPRALLEAPPAKKPMDPVVMACIVISLGLMSWTIFQVASYLMSSGPSEVNAAANEIRMGNEDVADAKLRGVLKANGANLVAKMTLAVSLIDRKKYDEAIALCDEILKADPSATDALRMRAVANAQLQKYDAAIADVDAYLKAEPEDDPSARSQALAVRAFSDMKLGKLDDSIADYTKAIKLDEKNMHLFASRGIVRDMKKRQPAANAGK